MKAGWEDARNLDEAKTRDVKEPIERRKSCGDDANEPVLGRAADVENPNGTVELCGDDAEEPMMVEAEDAEKPRETAQATDEDIHEADNKSSKVKAEYDENPPESWSSAAADSEEMIAISPNVVKAGIAEADDAKKPIMDGVAEETTESFYAVASEPVMEKAVAKIPREATQTTVEYPLSLNFQSTEVTAVEYA